MPKIWLNCIAFMTERWDGSLFVPVMLHAPNVARPARFLSIRRVRRGSYRLARLGAKYGPEIALDDLLRQLAGDCPLWHRSARWPEGCGAFYPDLEPPMRPPDMPRTPLRVVKGGKSK
jgi:hypothetical protein